MAAHRNHVEARSSRVPARQYVSETHDHKPDVVTFGATSQSIMFEIQISNIRREANRIASDADILAWTRNASGALGAYDLRKSAQLLRDAADQLDGLIQHQHKQAAE